MAVSKVAYDGHTLIDLTSDTAVESDVADGKYFHKANGERVQGTSGKVIVQGSDSSAYLIRPTAGETLAPLDCDRKSVLKKLGNTVGVNQLQKTQTTTATSTYSGVTISNSAKGVHLSGTATADIGIVYFDRSGYSQATIPGHTYLLFGCPSGGNGKYYLEPLMGAGADWCKGYPRDTGSGVIFTATKTNDAPDYIYGIRLFIVNGATNLDVDVNCYLIDLDIRYGSHGRIPSDLLSHPENWGRYYSGSLAANPGQLVNADGSVLTSIGRNIFDKTQTLTESYYLGSENAPHADSSWDYTDYIEIIPNTDYYASVTGSNPSTCFYDKDKNFISGLKNYTITANNKVFTTPANAKYLRTSIEKTKVDTFVISLYYPGESGYDQYYPFSVLAEVDTGSEVLRSAGAVADEKTPDGTITRRVGVVDLGTLTWTYQADYYGYPIFYSTDLRNTIRRPLSGEVANAICPKYNITSRANGISDKNIFFINTGGEVDIRDTAYTDAATFKSAMSGVYLYYELATPTTEQGTAFTGLQKVDGHGIEMVTGGTTGIPVPFTAQYLKTINAAPTDTIVITENGSHDVAMYDGAIVNVSGGGSLNLQSKNLPLNAAAPPEYVRPDNAYNGLSYVRVHTEDINPAWIRSGARVCGVVGTYVAPPTPASFPRTISLTVNINAPEVGHINVYWRQNDEDNPGQVCWDSYEIAYSAGANTDSSTITLCADDHDPSNIIVDGFYIGPLWGGALSSDITVVGGGLRYIETNGTGTETAYIVALSSTVTITINMPE